MCAVKKQQTESILREEIARYRKAMQEISELNADRSHGIHCRMMMVHCIAVNALKDE